MYKSERGHELIDQWSYGKGKPFLTVENYMKWYKLYLVEGGEVIPVDFPIYGEEDEELLQEFDLAAGDDSFYVDHVPNPRCVIALCKYKGWQLGFRALEMMIGRWELEAKNNYR